MAIPPPTPDKVPGDTGHVADHNFLTQGLIDLQNSVSNIQANQAAGLPGIILVDSFTGTDSARIQAALDAQAAQAASGVKSMVLFGSRQYNPTTQITATDGMSISGANWGNCDEVLSSAPYSTRINLSGLGSTPWINWGSARSVYIGNLSVQGNSSSSQFISASNIRWSRLYNLSFKGMKYVIAGNGGGNAPTTGLLADGWWNINSTASTSDAPIQLSGSDSIVFPQGLWIDDGGSRASSASGKYHMKLSMEKSIVGPMYMTCQGIGGILVAGYSAFDGDLVFTQARIEGQNKGNECHGALVRVTGGAGVVFDNCWFGYGMADPATGSNTADKAFVHIEGANNKVQFTNCTFGLGSSVTASTPMIYNNGSEVSATNTQRSPSTSSASDASVPWTTSMPRFRHDSGTSVVDHFTTSLSLPSGFRQSMTLVNSGGTTI